MQIRETEGKEGVDGFDKKGLRRIEGQLIIKGEKRRQLKLDMVFVIKENTHRFFLTMFPIWSNSLVTCSAVVCWAFI